MSTQQIKTIRNLKNVGVLEDVSVGRFDFEFAQYNLIYGFNGSGKTTISRLLDSFSENDRSPNFETAAEFSIELSDGTVLTSANTQSQISRYIAVFNEDYVAKSLFWTEGKAEAIIYVGEAQAELAKEIEDLEPKEQEAMASEVLASSEYSSAEKAEATIARNVARLIASETGQGRGYNATTLRSGYENTFSPSDKVSEDELRALKETINKSDIPDEASTTIQDISLATTARIVDDALRASLAKITIENLERRKDALGWVRYGVEIHTTEPDCLFCGNKISDDRLDNLKSALSDGFDKFRSTLQAAESSVRSIQSQILALKDKLGGTGELLPAHTKNVRERTKLISDHLKLANAWFDEWLTLLAKKLNQPETEKSLPLSEIRTWDAEYSDLVESWKASIETNNEAIRNFANEKEDAKAKITAHHLAHHESEFRSAVLTASEAKTAYDQASAQSAKITREIAEKRAALRDHQAAADEMNELLKGYLGHSQIQLVTNHEGYQISRNGSVEPKPLSEGERTAIAFCHFLATLKSEGRKPKDFVVVLDDPISSLDARGMTHAVSLVQKNFGDPHQLFILTHNLEFMREIKKWLGRKYEKGEAQLLFVECHVSDDERKSRIVKLPKLIREYESEYHYLYSLVKIIAESEGKDHTFAYLMPNAIRKVLDIFLAFKIPGGMGLSPKVDKVIGDYSGLDSNMVKSMERLAHLESHSESIGDVATFSAYTFEQIVEAAKSLRKLIEVVDPGHKSAMDKLCRS